MNREEIERTLERAEAKLREAAARMAAGQQRLEELNDERAQIIAESEVALHAMTDFERLREQSRRELAAVDFREAVQSRDQIIAKAAAALNAAVTLLGEIDGHRAAVVKAHERVRSIDSAAGRVAPDEPDLLHEPWQRMVSAVKSQLEEELEADIVDAAARSNAPQAIQALPEHLRILATQRRYELHEELRKR